MKKILTLSLFFFLSVSVFSQDVIIKKDGTEVKAKVEEVLPDVIKYREQENLTGPLYTIPLSEVFKINFQNGTSKFYGAAPQQPKAAAPQSTLRDTVAAIQKEIINYRAVSKYDSLMKQGKSNKGIGIVGCIFGPIAIVAGVVDIAVADGNGVLIGLGSAIIACGAALTILGPICIVKGKKQIAAAEQYKGAAYISPPMPIVNFASNRPGIGIGTRITF